MSEMEKKAIDITVDAQAGTDSYHIIVGSRGCESRIYRNGKKLKYVKRFSLSMSADSIPVLSLTRGTIPEESKE